MDIGLTVIVAAAGLGTRMDSEITKQKIILQGKPILIHTLEMLSQCTFVHNLILVVEKSEKDFWQRETVRAGVDHKIQKIITGGSSRFESVYQGLQAIDDLDGYVAVHDGARPFLDKRDFYHLFEQVKAKGAVVLAVPAKDTIKRVDSKTGEIIETLKREELWQTQTPQVFELEMLRTAYKLAIIEGYEGTDEAALVERAGFTVFIQRGSYNNFKITTPEDLKIAERMMKG